MRRSRTTLRLSRYLALLGVGLLLVSACSAPSKASPAPKPIPTGSVTATGSGGAPDLTRFYGQRLNWSGCGGDFQCARLTVPMDYAAPTGATVSLPVVRIRAVGGQRLGSLVLNPGGPGGSGVEYARAARVVTTAALRSHFDVVGFDPRGVGGSEPAIKCLNDAQLDKVLADDPTPDDAAEIQQFEADTQLLEKGCAAEQPLAAHVDTVSSAKDLDVLRAALGDAKLTYLGKSYGTFLGATYAGLFPDRVGRFVLDGAVDPTLNNEQVDAGQAHGFEVALGAFIDDCLRRSDCPLRGSHDQAVQQVRDLLAQADAKPLTGTPGRPVTEALATTGIYLPLYESSLWPDLRAALSAAFRGDGRILLQMADELSYRDSSGHYTSNINTAYYAISCLDSHPDVTLQDIAERADAMRNTTFGRGLEWSSLPCATWPIPATGKPGPIHAAGAPPILVVGTIRDPATPYAWAQSLAKQLQSGHLLTWDGDGHTAYTRGSQCIDNAVDAFFISGTLPPDGKTC